MFQTVRDIQSAVYDTAVLQAGASRGLLGKIQFIHAGAVCKRTRARQEATGMIQCKPNPSSRKQVPRQ